MVKKIRKYKIFVTASNFNTKNGLFLNSSLVELLFLLQFFAPPQKGAPLVLPGDGREEQCQELRCRKTQGNCPLSLSF